MFGSTSVELSSVLSLREEIESRCHTGLRHLLAEHTFVGVVTSRLSLLQHQTRLYLVNHRRLAEQLFYQICLYQFGALGLLEIEVGTAPAGWNRRLEIDVDTVAGDRLMLVAKAGV